MYLRRTIGFAIFSFLLIFNMMHSQSANKSDTYIHVRGSSAMFSLIQPLAEAYMKEHPGTFVILTTSSDGSSFRGLKSLLEGTSDIAMSTEEPDDLIEEMMIEKKARLTRTIIGYDLVTPFVNVNNPISSLTEVELKQVYTGEIGNWKNLGGSDGAILAASQLPGSPAFSTWNKFILDGEALPSLEVKKMNAHQLLKYVENHEDAIGYGSVQLIKNSKKVKKLAVDNVAADYENIKKSQYKMNRELVLYTQESSSQDVKRFVEYVTEHGQDQINQTLFFNK